MDLRSFATRLSLGLTLGLVATVGAGCAPAEEEEEQGTSEDMVKAKAKEEEKDTSDRWRPGWGTILGLPTFLGGGAAADRSPAWKGKAGCAGDLKPGTRALGRKLKKEFGDKISALGGYNCRPLGHDATRMSLHGTGRALDVHTTKAKGGDAIADYLVQHSANLGVERIIWRNTEWFAFTVGSWSWSYGGGGKDDHTDHIHVELTASAAADNGICATVAECAFDLVSGDADSE